MKFPKVGGKRAFSGFGACQGTTCQAVRARAACGLCCGGAWVLVWYEHPTLEWAEGSGLARSKLDFFLIFHEII